MADSESETQQLDDATLVRRVKEGSSPAFEELFLRYRHKVYSLAYRMTGNPSDAEDLCQEIFLQLMRKFGSFQQRSSFSTWLYRVAINRSRDYLRRKKRGQELSLDEEKAEAKGRGRARKGEPEPSAVSAEARDIVQRGLADLPVNLRVPLVLHELEGFQYREIAAMLRLPVGTVKSRIFRGRAKLGEILEPHKEQWR